MRNDPVYTVWRIEFASEEALKGIEDRLRAAADRTAEWSHTITSYPFGAAITTTETHRFDRYFADVRVAMGPTLLTRLLLFRRLPDAPRDWKDVMAKVIRDIQDRAANTSVTLEYRGNEEPVPVNTGVVESSVPPSPAGR